jgi:hypothetical protein
MKERLKFFLRTEQVLVPTPLAENLGRLLVRSG